MRLSLERSQVEDSRCRGFGDAAHDTYFGVGLLGHARRWHHKGMNGSLRSWRPFSCSWACHAAGKTTMTKRLADEHGALRLTPDEWMIPLFGVSEAGGKRDLLEGRLISVALQLLRLGTDVVLDFGCWVREERSALRWLAEREGASFRLIYVPVDRAAQLKHIEQRCRQTPMRRSPSTWRTSTGGGISSRSPTPRSWRASTLRPHLPATRTGSVGLKLDGPRSRPADSPAGSHPECACPSC